MGIKATFRARREALGLSQNDVAQALGVDRTTVKRWEREGMSGPPEDALAYIEQMQSIFDAAVDETITTVEEKFGEHLPRVVQLSYWKSQDERERYTLETDSYGMVNAITREVAAYFAELGCGIEFCYPGENDTVDTARDLRTSI